MWPYLLGHYKWDFGPAEQAAADSRVQEAYEHKLSDWMAIEAIVRQRDKEINAANIAKLSGNGISMSTVVVIHCTDIIAILHWNMCIIFIARHPRAKFLQLV